MNKSIDGCEARIWLVLKQLVDYVDNCMRSGLVEYFGPGLLADRWELELRIARVHAMDLIFRRRS